PAKKVFEDDEFVSFHDINPAAPVHLLLIPRRHVVSLQDIAEGDAEKVETGNAEGQVLTLIAHYKMNQ
ncbi:scavenger mRNA decapping enzyme domain protein, partial [Bordetella bronchiseptica A1-7]